MEKRMGENINDTKSETEYASAEDHLNLHKAVSNEKILFQR